MEDLREIRFPVGSARVSEFQSCRLQVEVRLPVADFTMVSPTASWWSYAGIVYITWRVYWANRMPIMDCDEVYNYWEPLHFLHSGM